MNNEQEIRAKHNELCDVVHDVIDMIVKYEMKRMAVTLLPLGAWGLALLVAIVVIALTR